MSIDTALIHTGGGELEKPRLILGFIPLTDCAPLAVAHELGYFREEGLEVELSSEASWANIRDKVALGALDAAHMLAPMPLAASLGIAGPKKPMLTACVLNLGGNAITLSQTLYQRLEALDAERPRRRPYAAHGLKRLIDAGAERGRPPLTFASVFPTSTHNYQLRYWLAAVGIDPERDVRLVVIPPPQMVYALANDEIAGYCVGEPWNSLAIRRGLGVGLISSHELWNNSMEKVLGVTEAWAARHPRTHHALVRAVLRACQWLDAPAHRAQAAELLARPQYVGAGREVIEPALSGRFRYRWDEPVPPQPDFMSFHRHVANFPWRSQGMWFGRQMRRWGQLAAGAELVAAVERSFRTDLYRQAAASLGWPVPREDYKSEGRHAAARSVDASGGALTLGADLFFDGSRFDGLASEADSKGGSHDRLAP